MVMDEITMDVVNGWVMMEVVMEKVRIKMVVIMSQRQSGCGVDGLFLGQLWIERGQGYDGCGHGSSQSGCGQPFSGKLVCCKESCYQQLFGPKDSLTTKQKRES